MLSGLQKFLPLITQFGSYLKMGIDHYADLRSAGKEAGPEIISMYLYQKMEGWSPKIGNTNLLDETTRASGARFLAGIAVNFANSLPPTSQV